MQGIIVLASTFDRKSVVPLCDLSFIPNVAEKKLETRGKQLRCKIARICGPLSNCTVAKVTATTSAGAAVPQSPHYYN